MFQNFHLISELTAVENVKLSMDIFNLFEGRRIAQREMYARSSELLARVGLERELKKKPPQLSGGQKFGGQAPSPRGGRGSGLPSLPSFTSTASCPILVTEETGIISVPLTVIIDLPTTVFASATFSIETEGTSKLFSLFFLIFVI